MKEVSDSQNTLPWLFLIDFCKVKILKECNISQNRYWALKLSTLSFHMSDSLDTYRADVAAPKASIYGVSSKSTNFYKLLSFLKLLM